MSICQLCGQYVKPETWHGCAVSRPMLDADTQLESLRAKYTRAVHALQDIAALKAKPKTSGREIAIHALAMLGEPRETE